MTSRLDRLFILLESGSSAVTRRAAAKQIGEVQRLHPHELHKLLNRLVIYMHSHSWDTRVAASQAVQAILENVPQWNGPENVNNIRENEKTETSSVKFDTASIQSRFSFDKFNLQIILANGARLMGSEGKEFDVAENEEIDSRERLTTQRAILNEQLGFSVAKKLGVNIDELVTLEDMEQSTSKSEIKPETIDVQDIINNQASSSQQISESGMSSREINRAKRKARQVQASLSISRNNSLKEEPELKKVKTEPSGESLFNSEPVPDFTGVWIDAVEWPLEGFCNKLYTDLFSPRWEIRHGAATALRELMKTHISGGGIKSFMTFDEQQNAHNIWLEDAALRMLCVLALDRFGDFVTDQVVAPVRETCAQVLGTILKEMPNDLIQKTVEILQSFIKQKDWEVRHAGIMGLKYFLVVREDLIENYLPLIIKDIVNGLLDSVDDVSSVSASALIPIASHLPKLLSREQVSAIVKMVFDLLLEQDEVAAACNSFLGLLASLLSLPNALHNWIEMEQMEILIPRLWPYLSHQSSSVRRSTLQTLRKLTDKTDNLSTTAATTNGNTTAPLNFGVNFWPSFLLQDALRHIFQRVLVEHIEDIQSLVVEVWTNIVSHSNLEILLPAVCPLVSCWMCLAMQPAKLAFEPSLMVDATSKASRLVGDTSAMPTQKWFLGGAETISQDIRENNVIRARYKACKMLGLLSTFLVLPAPNVVYKTAAESPMFCYAKLLLGYLSSRSSLQRIVSSMIITFWAENDPTIVAPPILQERLRASLTEYIYFDEISTMVTRLLQEASDFLASLKQYKVHLPQFDGAQRLLTLDQIKDLSTTATDNLKARFQLKTKVANLLEDRRKSLFNSYSSTNVEQMQLNISTQSSLACAVSRLRCLPEKLNPVVKPLMESIKREENEIMQKMAAESLTYLLSQTGVRKPSPNSKIITNLSTLLRSDEEFTPPLGLVNSELKNFKPNGEIVNPYYGIITLQKQMKTDVQILSSSGPGSSRGPGRPCLDMPLEDSDDPIRKAAKNQRIGSTFAVQSSCEYFAESLPQALPTLWQLMFDVLMKIDRNEFERVDEEESTNLINSLQLLEVSSPFLHKNLHNHLFEALPKLCLLVQHPLKAIRHLTARCLATLASINAKHVMVFVINELVPLLTQIESPINREGSIEAITWVVKKLQFQIVPYVVLLIVPILGRMSDKNDNVRLMSTSCFATLIFLMPLDGLTLDQEQDLTGDLKNRKMKDKEFLNYLFCPKSIPDFKVPVPIGAELRSYQQAGINWLWFLNKFSLCGILCDDMGLGKTLQTICILAGDHHQRVVDKKALLPSLVVCPPTLTGHWVYEIRNFVSEKFLSPLQYFGLPIEREKLRNQIKHHNLVIASYDIVRKDIEFFQTVHWNYCVLDEGHIIKNGKTKCSKAIKLLYANHRLILSGTPIQNNVLELHSLFDFLMPGFLGSEKQFQVRFSRPILASRDPKSSPKEQEAGALAMESLHRQVLPFLLRRVKEDVLTDLPPKITQDLLCELSPLQERLYEDFSNTHVESNLRKSLESISATEVATKNKTHVFQALRYLQNVCNHPKLVLKPHHPEYQNIILDMQKNNTSLDDIEHSAKLPALKQLLLDCGIGMTNDEMSVNQHRALVFCQLKAMLDIIENDLLKKHLPGVSYLRLDGSVPANMRHEIVNNFNSDATIDILLLTTQVGGLGLNLTGADTVIFVEHDYNPMKDLQAMDRAHRIGQKRVVNVYRLITRKSLEEKIMGLQKFKLLTAHTVVKNNQSMETMGTDQLLDLFNLSEHDKDGKKTQNNSTSMKSMLENLPELWDDQQYAEEFDMTQFIEGLKK